MNETDYFNSREFIFSINKHERQLGKASKIGFEYIATFHLSNKINTLRLWFV